MVSAFHVAPPSEVEKSSPRLKAALEVSDVDSQPRRGLVKANEAGEATASA